MKRILIGLLLILSGGYSTLSFATQQDGGFSYCTEPVEVVVPDKKVYEGFKNDPDYDYDRENPVAPLKESFIERLLNKFFEWFFKNASSTSIKTVSGLTYLVIGVVLVMGLFLIFYIYRPSLFFRNKSNRIDYRVEDDNIYGWDFEKLIADALRDKEYNHAIRWKYLQTLKGMEERELIVWNPNKTVIEYTYEIKNSSVRDVFKDLSWLFLYFRYGNFQASESHYEETERLATEIAKGLSR